MVSDKSKSSHHKTENTFIFQTFHERLANVNIDVARKLGKFSSTPEDADTFFGEALDKWTDLNCTKHFVDFRKEITGEVQTFVQLVHHQKDVVAALQKHLKVENSLAVQPLLDLVVQLARDLQGDFYPYFPDFFHLCVWLLGVRHHDVEVLEQTFTCLAYVFKFLWRLMLKDIHNVYGLFCPLLGTQYKEYINTFASECFSFLMRKVKDKSELVEFMLLSLQEREDQAQGVGTLLFEMMKGVKNQFHSLTEQVLPVILSKLSEVSLPQSLVEVSLRQTLTLMAQHTNLEHSTVLWSALLKHLQEVNESMQSEHASTLDNNFEVTLSLIEILVKHKKGGLIGKGNHLVEVLCCLLQASHLSEGCVHRLLDVLAAVLLAERVTLEPQHRPKLISKIYNSAFRREAIFHFTRQVFELPLFEKDVLPALLGYCHTVCGLPLTSDDKSLEEGGPHTDVLELLVSLCVHKSPPWKGVMDGDHLKSYKLDFTATSNSKAKNKTLNDDRFSVWVCNTLDRLTGSISTDKQLRDVWLCVYIVSRIDGVEKTRVVKLLNNVILELQDKILEKQILNSGLAETVLLEASLSLFDLMKEKDFVKALSDVLKIKELLSHAPGSVSILRLSDLYYSCVRSVDGSYRELGEWEFTEVYRLIENNFTSPHHQVRLLSLHICCQFDFPLPTLPAEKQDIPQPGVFAICLCAEQIRPDMNTYRDILMHLRKLHHDLIQSQLPLGDYNLVPLKFLLGMLHSNLVLMWEPIIELIQSHASSLHLDTFWQVYRPCLEESAGHTEKQLQRESRGKAFNASMLESSSMDVSVEAAETVDLGQYTQDWCGLVDRVNWTSYRQLLWQAMTSFPGTCEARTRILSPMLFRFLEKEYNPEDVTAAKYQDVRKADLKSADDSMVDEGETTLDEADLDESRPANQEAGGGGVVQSAHSKRRRASNKALVLHLKVFSLFRDPRSCYLEPRLRELYFSLLQHRDLGIQKVVFNCLLTYKHKYLTPYRENFERLLDDKHFKKEIVLFSIDQDVTTIQPEHRPDLMPILMRILYGKMQTKTGKDTSGKNQSEVRKNLVLRFLAGSTQQELTVFFDLVFQPFLHLCQGSLTEQITAGLTDLDMSQVIPLRKQQGMLDTMEIMMKKLGHLIEAYLPRLLAILLSLAAQYVYLLEHRDQMSPKLIHFVKNLRQIVHSRIIQFFSAFENYAFTQNEIDAIFEAAVWPNLEKLEYEGTYSTTGLLSLLSAWTNTSRFFPLLAKTHPVTPALTPLPHVFALLGARQVDKSVVSLVMEMTENLLTMEDFEETPNCPLVSVGPTVKCPPDSADLTFGTRLVIPHVSCILDHLKSVVIRLSSEKNKKKAVPLTELTILSRLSQHVTDEEQSCAVVELLLPFLSRHVNTSTDTEVHVLTALTHLLARVGQPGRFWGDICRLFSTLSSRRSRALLCDIVVSVETKDPSSGRPMSALVSGLNAWDPKRVEEPDYMSRLDAYQGCVKVIQDRGQGLNSVWCQMLLHNCVYFLATTDDMSLRDSSSHCLHQLIERLSACEGEGGHKSPLFTQLIRDSLLPQIRDKLKIKMEVSRHEFINLFALLVRKFPQCPVFSDFVPLLDQNDPEMDFFNNLVHIQLHRRARALRRICRQLTEHKMKTDSIVLYLLPCVLCYLKDEQYAKASNLLDAAVEALGALCRVLPWPRYMLLLNYYLERLPKAADNQKLLVRVVVSILDNFHYDLRNCRQLTAPGTVALPGETPKEVVAMETEQKEEDGNEDTEERDVHDVINEDQVDEGTEASGSGVTESDMDVDTNETGTAIEVTSHFQVCGAGLATRINKYIVRAILPKLHKLLTRKSRSDDIHKKAEASKYAEDEEVLRVPIALAMVKLLQTLPHGILEANLPNVLLKVCMFMKSRANDIRVTARDTLVKILHSLGARFFSYILRELTSLLKRGYQLHVLSYTVWALLKHVHDNNSLKPGDLDPCIPSLVQVLNEELFGQVAEEKEVAGIKGKLPEARSSKSFDSYHILALYITKSSLPKIIVPLKQQLEKGHSHVTARKAGEVLRKMGSGLVDNKGIELSSLLTFVYGVTTESLPMLNQSDKKEDKEKTVDPRRQPTDTYIVKSEPKRGGKKPKTHAKTNLHVIVEFGFQVLHELLKRSRLSSSEHAHLELVDPFVTPVCDSLTAKHLKVSTTALRCLVWLLKFPLPSLNTLIPTISNHIFLLLSTFAATGAARGDNFELVVMCFKTLTVLVRDVQYHSISQEQLQVLLGYVEEDIHDYTRQATAFTLLKAILSRKLVVPEVHEVIRKVQELSVSSEQPNIRLQCRQVMAQFLLDYPLGTKLKSHLEFYIVQLNYEHESGRESALEMLATVFSSFPQKVLSEHSGLFFIPLASRLVNDDSSKCRKLASLAIKSLLVKLSSSQRDHLFNMCLSWLQESKVLMRKLAAITCGLFVEVEASAFERHLHTVLPVLEHQIQPSKYQQDVSEGEEREMDQLLFNLLSVLMKIIRECGLTVKPKWSPKLVHVWESIEEHLLYPHVWVRLVCAQLFGVLFASWSVEDLVDSASKHQETGNTQSDKKTEKQKKKKRRKDKENGGTDTALDTSLDTTANTDYLLGDLDLKLHTLCGLFCRQFSEPELSEELAEQIIKNLVFVTKILKIKSNDDTQVGSQPTQEDTDSTSKTASIRWLVKRMCKEAKNENTSTPKLTLKRRSVVKWLGAVSVEVGEEGVIRYISLMLPTLYREYNNNSPQADAELKSLCNEVMDLLKSIVGVEVFTTHYAACQKSVLEKRESRKQRLAVEAVSNPEISAVKKMKKNLAKRDAKKRKIQDKRPTLKMKKRKQAMEQS